MYLSDTTEGRGRDRGSGCYESRVPVDTSRFKLSDILFVTH